MWLFWRGVGNRNLAFELECDNEQKGKILDKLLDIEVKYYDKQENKDGIYVKNNTQYINYSICNYTEFYKENNYSINNNKELKCLNKFNENIEGNYGDNIFKYLEISLLSKNNLSNEYFQEIDDILLNNNCKLKLHYHDISINFDNYKNPINSFGNELFLQLNPELTIKMNVFFINQYFINNNNLFFPHQDKNKQKVFVNNSFSRNEQYFVYKGLNRGERRPREYQYYAQIFIRADKIKKEVKRKYQNIFEFYGDTFTIWEIFNFVTFFLHKLLFKLVIKSEVKLSIEKEIFFLKRENINFNFSKIKKLIEKTEKSSKDDVNKKKDDINIPTEQNITQNENNQNTNNSSDQIKTQKENNSENNSNKKIKCCKCFKCLFCQNLKYIIDGYKMIDNIIESKLDIVYYLKNMIFFEKLMNIDKISTNEEEIKKLFEKDY